MSGVYNGWSSGKPTENLKSKIKTPMTLSMHQEALGRCSDRLRSRQSQSNIKGLCFSAGKIVSYFKGKGKRAIWGQGDGINLRSLDHWEVQRSHFHRRVSYSSRPYDAWPVLCRHAQSNYCECFPLLHRTIDKAIGEEKEKG